MRRLLIVLVWSLAVFSLFAGCSSRYEADTASPEGPKPVAAKTPDLVDAAKDDQEETFVIRAKHYQTEGPCIQLGDDLGMPIIDAFEVVEVVEGELKIKNVLVRTLSGPGAKYPQELTEGEVYTLRLTPTKGTRQQIRENEEKGYPWLWVDEDEIEGLSTKD